MSNLRFPIGEFRRKANYSLEERRANIALFKQAPEALANALAGLSDAQLDTTYREGGWTVRQVAHHVPDSHLNAYTRVKLALTEDKPVIKPYDEVAWAKLADTQHAPLEVSLALLEAVHTRLVILFESLKDADWQREYLHPVNGPTSIETALASYVWHGQHHTAHITELRKRKGW
jgi:uncharacterized damage-inducible protein DinB